MTYLTHLTSLSPEGAAAQSPGLPASATLEPKQENFSTARRLRQCSKTSRGRNRDAVEISDCFLPQGSRGGNPGLRGIAPSGQRQTVDHANWPM